MEDNVAGKRIIILGCPGSGKSTFARKLHESCGLPLFHLDNIWWKFDRTHITRDEFDHRLETLMKSEKWIIDGDYSRTYETRIRMCDTVIFLDYSLEECMKGIEERVGKKRDDIPWAENELDGELVALVYNYHKDNRPKIYELLEKYPGKKVMVFKSRKQAESWLLQMSELRYDM